MKPNPFFALRHLLFFVLTSASIVGVSAQTNTTTDQPKEASVFLKTSPYLNKGSFIFGVNGGLNISNENVYSKTFARNTYGADVSLSAGYFFGKHFSLSLLLGTNFAGTSLNQTNSKGQDSASAYSVLSGHIGIGATVYFLRNAFFQLRYRYGNDASLLVQLHDANLTARSGVSTLEASLGYMLFVSPRISINPAIQYQRFLDYPVANLSSDRGAQRFSLSLGISYLLPRKNK